MLNRQQIASIASLAAGCFAAPLGGQTIPGAVLAKREPHHHVAFEDATLRVLRVRVPPHDSTMLHEHDPDYFWIALGPSSVVNARPGMPDAVIKSADLSVHYTPGHFAHVARNPGDVNFDNITVELLRAQSHVHNLCEPALSGQPLDCPASTIDFGGARDRPAFATDQLRVGTAELSADATMHAPSSAKRDVWLIALDQREAAQLSIDGGGRWVGGVYHADKQGWGVRNKSGHPVRMLVVTN